MYNSTITKKKSRVKAYIYLIFYEGDGFIAKTVVPHSLLFYLLHETLYLKNYFLNVCLPLNPL